VLTDRAFQHAVAAAGDGLPLVFALERADGAVSRYETRVFPESHPLFAANFAYAERVFKFLLWQRGGWRAYVGGHNWIGEWIRECYSPTGVRAFDYRFMGEEVYERPFTVLPALIDISKPVIFRRLLIASILLLPGKETTAKRAPGDHAQTLFTV